MSGITHHKHPKN